MFETYLTVVGRLISEPDTRTVSTGDKLCTFRMVAQERRLNRDSGEWVDGDKLYVNVKCWRKLAENVPGSLFQGDHVVVHGRLYLNQYETPSGESRQTIDLDARSIGPDLFWCRAMLQRPNRAGAPGDEAVTPSALAA
jgi:single-strand DNA-binding protein